MPRGKVRVSSSRQPGLLWQQDIPSRGDANDPLDPRFLRHDGVSAENACLRTQGELRCPGTLPSKDRLREALRRAAGPPPAVLLRKFQSAPEGMPRTSSADTSASGLRQRGALHSLRSLPTPLWIEEEVRVLHRDYGKPGLSVRSIAAKLGRTPNQVMLKARLLGLKSGT